MDVLILGYKGMLGHMVYRYLKDQNFNISIINSRFPSKEFKHQVKSFKGDFIINCIGAIPQKTSIFDINTKLPIWLSNNIKTKIIHPGTDCEIDDDNYGISKQKAKEYIINKSKNTKILKASIIGPEINSKNSLFEWFINSEKEVKGYTRAMWSGVTTLEWAKQCLNMINNWDSYEKENIIESTCLSKYDLLNLIKEIFNKDIIITPNDNFISNKCLIGNIKSQDIKTQLQELKKYY